MVVCGGSSLSSNEKYAPLLITCSASLCKLLGGTPCLHFLYDVRQISSEYTNFQIARVVVIFYNSEFVS